MKRLKTAVFGITVLAVLAFAGVGTGVASGGSSARLAAVGSGSSALGPIVVDSRGHTLYLFEKDRRGASACSGACLVYWPPLLTSGTPTAIKGARPSLLGSIRRADGTRQVTYRDTRSTSSPGTLGAGRPTVRVSRTRAVGTYSCLLARRSIETEGRLLASGQGRCGSLRQDAAIRTWTKGHSRTLGPRAVPLPVKSGHRDRMPRDALYFCAGDQTSPLSFPARVRVRFRCWLPSAFMV